MNIFRTLASGKNAFREEFVSAFIAYLFSPKMDHGLNYLLRSRLLTSVSEKNRTKPLKLLADGLKNQLWESILEPTAPQPVVELEVPYGGGKGYIDVVVRCDDWFILIENKISAASKTDNQVREQYEGFCELLRTRDFKEDEYRILMIYLVPAVQGGEGWSVPDSFEKEMGKVHLRPSDDKVLISWQPVSSTEEEPVSMVKLLRGILHDEAIGSISPIGPDVRHSLLSLIDFALGEFGGYHYPKAAVSRRGEPKTKVADILVMEGSYFVGVRAGKAGAIDSAWRKPEFLSYQLTVTEDPNRGWQYLPLAEFKALVRWALDPERESLAGLQFDGKPFYTPVLFNVAKFGKTDLWIGVRGGLTALRALSPDEIRERRVWEISHKEKSSQWFTGETFCAILEEKGVFYG